MEMNVSGPTSQALKLPIPRLPNLHMSNTKFPEMLIPNNWPPTTSAQFPTTLPSTQQVISCQPMSKPTPNKRGRKPLSRMPETKKHIQNLTNQRAFRRRREDYVRTLETKAATYELLYSDAQRDIKMLRERLAMLEKRLAKTQENNEDKCDGNMACGASCGTSCGTQIYEESQQMQNNGDTNGEVIMSNGPYDGNRTTPTTTSFPFNEQRYQQQITSKADSETTNTPESVDDIINDPVFCETKDGELCFCEPLDGLDVNDYEKDATQFSTIGRYDFEQRKGKRMWIINSGSVAAQCMPPTSTVPYSTNVTTCGDSPKCCPTLPLPEQPENYYPQTSSSNLTSHHHPLNLKWILDDSNRDENNDGSV